LVRARPGAESVPSVVAEIDPVFQRRHLSVVMLPVAVREALVTSPRVRVLIPPAERKGDCCWCRRCRRL